jgi:hypothetical protein
MRSGRRIGGIGGIGRIGRIGGIGGIGRIGGIWALICWPGCRARSAASRTRWQRQSLPGNHAVAEWADARLWAVSCAG